MGYRRRLAIAAAVVALSVAAAPRRARADTPAASAASAAPAAPAATAASAAAPSAAAPQATSGSAAGLEYSLTANGIRIAQGATVNDLPLPGCEPRAIAREGTRVYVACAGSGLVLLDATNPAAPTVAARAPTDGEAVAFHVLDGKVWVEIARVEARPAAAIVRGATFGAGAGAAGARGAAGAGEPAGSSGEAAQQGAGGAGASGRRSLVAPPRATGLFELELGSRLFLPIGDIGFGALGAVKGAYRFEAPFALHAEVSPLGVATGKKGVIGTAAGHVIAAFDTTLFEVGLGIGGATLNSPTADASSSLSFAQLARIGAEDGLALFGRTNIIVDNDRFIVGSVEVTGQAAVAQRWWLLLTGGGGPIGFAYGDVGVRYLVSGDTTRGGFFVSGRVGGAAIFKSTRTSTTFPGGTTSYYLVEKKADYAGPALGLALGWRL